jgi:hypothetical protein
MKEADPTGRRKRKTGGREDGKGEHELKGAGEAGASPLRGKGRVWEEKPVGVRRFVEEEEYLGLGSEVYPKIVEVLTRIFNGKHQEAVLCWGIGSGKSYLCSLALTYMLYRTLCLRNPQKYYGLAEGSPIHIVNVGPSARVAEKAVYGTVRQLVRRSPWFEQHVPDRRMRKELHFPKDIEVLPGNSSEMFPLGLNVLCATMDEASYFVETAGGDREAAEEVYLALQRRVKSRFGTRGLMLIASSPRHNDDFITSKLVEAETNRTIHASRMATWETKPKEKFCGKRFVCEGLKIPVELKAEFTSNPQKALRDLAARPGSAYQPFFVEMRGLEEAGRQDGRKRRTATATAWGIRLRGMGRSRRGSSPMTRSRGSCTWTWGCGGMRAESPWPRP